MDSVPQSYIRPMHFRLNIQCPNKLNGESRNFECTHVYKETAHAEKVLNDFLEISRVVFKTLPNACF